MTFPVVTIRHCDKHFLDADQLFTDTIIAGKSCLMQRVGKKLCEFCPREIPPHRRQ